MIRKTIISVFLSAVILFSGAFTPVAQASVVDDTIVAYSEASWAQAMLSGILSTSGAMFISPLAGIAGGVVAEGINNLAEWYAAGHTDQEILDEYNSYVTDLQTDLGTTTLIDGGVRFYFWPGDEWYQTSRVDDNGTVFTDTAVHYSLIGTYESDSACYAITKMTGFLRVPYAAHVTTGIVVTGVYNSVELTGTLYDNELKSEGSSISVVGTDVYGWGSVRIVVPYGVVSSGVIRAYADMIPISGTSLTGQDITINSRPTSLVVPVGVRNEDNSYTVYNQTIVNETDSTVFNPVTNITTVFTDWAFDYSTRTYTLTLEDGSTVTVQYGDSNITIVEGDVTYNAYYVIPSEEDPGADPDDPGTDDGSGWAWLKGAWTEMMDKLTGILEAITDLELSPEINVDVEVGGEEEVTQESWFSELLTKFAFLTSIHDIYSQLIADVTSDAATAVAVADGEVMLADVTSGHAAIDGSRTYTAPELAISFGSSDKYGVDWANIRALDLSWYAPHKETVDGILSGILWLSYLFLLIKRAPGIIQGAEMVTEDRIKIYDWRMRH